MNNKQREEIEIEISKHKPSWDKIGTFTWKDDKVSYSGSLVIGSDATLNNLISVGGYLIIDSNATLEARNLTSVGGYLDVYSKATLNNLTSVGGSLYIDSNATLEARNLTSVGGSLSVYSKATLEAPKLTNKDFVRNMKELEERFGFIKADGIGIQFEKKRKYKEYTIYITPYRNSNIAYVVTNGKYSAHAKTIKTAIIDIRFKEQGRNMSDYEDLTLDSKLSYEDAIVMYRVITGACSGGTEQFLSQHNLSTRKQYTVQEIIDLTQGQYGNETLKGFLKENIK